MFNKLDMGDMYPILKNIYPQLTMDISDSIMSPMVEATCSYQFDFYQNDEYKPFMDYFTKSLALRDLITQIEVKQNLITLLKDNVDSKILITGLIDIQVNIDLLKECSNIMIEELNNNIVNNKIKDDGHMLMIIEDDYNYRLRFDRLNKNVLVIKDKNGNIINMTKEIIDEIFKSLDNNDNIDIKEE